MAHYAAPPTGLEKRKEIYSFMHLNRFKPVGCKYPVFALAFVGSTLMKFGASQALDDIAGEKSGVEDCLLVFGHHAALEGVEKTARTKV